MLPLSGVRVIAIEQYGQGERVRRVSHPSGDIALLAPPFRCPGEDLPCCAAPPL